MKTRKKLSSNMCNFDCFNCIYEDCINDMLKQSDINVQNDFDNTIKHHCTEQQLKDAKLYYYRHKEKCKQKNKDYYNSHKEKFKEYNRLRKLEHPINKEKQHEYYIRWRDKKKGLLDGSK